MCGEAVHPIGMKKQFSTVIQEEKELEHMHVSSGKLGMQLTLLPEDLAKPQTHSLLMLFIKINRGFCENAENVLERRRDNYG